MPITPQTTLAELEIECLKLGATLRFFPLTNLSIEDFSPGAPPSHRWGILIMSAGYATVATGELLADAINAAFETHRDRLQRHELLEQTGRGVPR